ncbi:hypothetical protein MHYP_G00021770 [Metynnis hypsauchen]
MRSTSATDAGSYWCCVELYGADAKSHFELQVTEGAPDLYVNNQMVTASEGSSVLISCFHQNQIPKRWCKLRGECGKESMHGATVELIDSDKCLKVNISNLRVEHTGWYFCSVGALQMPIYISVTTTLPAQTMALNQTRFPERKSFVWLIILGVVLVAFAAVILIKLLKQKCKCKTSSEQNRTENVYVSMCRKESSKVSTVYSSIELHLVLSY